MSVENGELKQHTLDRQLTIMINCVMLTVIVAKAFRAIPLSPK